MKKGFFLYLFLLLLAVSCTKKEASSDQLLSVDKFATADSFESEDGVRFLANDDAIAAAFTLDYRPQKAEGEDEAEVTLKPTPPFKVRTYESYYKQLKALTNPEPPQGNE